MISRFLLTGVGVLATVAASLAATYTWTDATGDHDLSNTNNWNPIPPTANGQFYNSWVIDDSAPGASTQGVWGAGSPTYPHVNTITFNKTGMFDMSGRGTWLDQNAITVSKPGSTGVVDYLATSNPTMDVTTNSLLFVHDWPGWPGTWLKTGAGVVQMENHLRHDGVGWNVQNGILEARVAPGGYRVRLESLAGSGEFRVFGGQAAYVAVRTNGFTFTGQITVRTPAAGLSSWLDLETDATTPWSNVRICVETGAVLFAGSFAAGAGDDEPTKTNITFQASDISGQGEIRVYKDYWFGPVHTVTLQGSQLRPGPVAGRFTVTGNLRFAKDGSSNAVFKVDVASKGSTPGSNYDQLLVTGVPGGGGNVSSLSDANNPLADCDLVVDLSALPLSTSLGTNVLTILTSANNFAGSSFGKVTWVKGSGTVNYLNQKVTLTDVTGMYPEGTAVLVR